MGGERPPSDRVSRPPSARVSRPHSLRVAEEEEKRASQRDLEAKAAEEGKALTAKVDYDSETENVQPESNGEVEVASRERTPAWYLSFFAIYIFTPLYMFVTILGAYLSQDTETIVFGPNETSACADATVSTPLSSGWRLGLSFIPFLLVVNGILGLNWSSHFVAPWTCVITILLGIWLFDGNGWLAEFDFVTTIGIVILTVMERILWTLFDYAFNVFAAFLFLEVVERWGVVRSMQDEFEVLCDNPTQKIILVLFCFAIIIAVVAPGGSNFLIAGSILIRMNIGNEETETGKIEQGRRIAAICLFGNGLTSAFNLVGVCITAIAEDIIPTATKNGVLHPCTLDNGPAALLSCAEKQIGLQFSIQFMIFCIASPFLMAYLFHKSFNDEMKSNSVLMLGCGIVYGLFQLLTAWLLGPELPCLTSAGGAFVFYLAYRFLPERIRGKGDDANSEPFEFKRFVQKHSYALPFVMLMGLLFLMRAIPGLEDALQGGNSKTAQSILNPTIMNVVALCGKWKRSFPWLSHSGMIVIWCALLTPFIVPFRSTSLEREKTHHEHKEEISEEEFHKRYMEVMKGSLKESIKESSPILVSIAAYATLAKVMAGFAMTQSIAQAFVDGLEGVPAVFTLFSPVIGFLGAGLTGSTTTSNFLFGQLQLNTAINLGLVTPTQGSAWAVAGVQILGSSAGEIISPMNAVFSAVLLKSAVPESDIIKQVLGVFVVWMGMCMLVSLLALSALSSVYV